MTTENRRGLWRKLSLFYASRRGLDPVLVRSHEFTVGCRNPAFRLLLASRFRQDYAAAQLVVTSRLHAALPCIAFGTPVIVIPSEPASRRFEGLLPERVIATRQAFRMESDRLIRKALADPVLVPAYATALRREVEGRTGAKGANWYQRINERSSEVFEARL